KTFTCSWLRKSGNRVGGDHDARWHIHISIGCDHTTTKYGDTREVSDISSGTDKVNSIAFDDDRTVQRFIRTSRPVRVFNLNPETACHLVIVILDQVGTSSGG